MICCRRPQETTFYKALETKEHTMPLTSDPIQPNGTIIAGVDPQSNAYINRITSEPTNNNTEDKSTSGAAQSVSHPPSEAPAETSNDITDVDFPPEFRRIQAELRGRKQRYSSVVSQDQVSTRTEESGTKRPLRIQLETIDRAAVRRRRRNSRYAIAARSSFLSGEQVVIFFIDNLHNLEVKKNIFV